METQRFIKISLEFIQGPLREQGGPFYIYCLLCTFADFSTGKNCHPKIQTLVSKTGWHRRRLERALEDLCEVGAIRRKRTGKANEYELLGWPGNGKTDATESVVSPKTDATESVVSDATESVVSDATESVVSGRLHPYGPRASYQEPLPRGEVGGAVKPYAVVAEPASPTLPPPRPPESVSLVIPLDPPQAAREILNELCLPQTKAYREPVIEAVMLEMKRLRCNVEHAQEYILSEAQSDTQRGVLLDPFYFADLKWRGTKNGNKAEQRKSYNLAVNARVKQRIRWHLGAS